jgi:transposase
MKNTIVGVDLAKEVIQVCIVKKNKVISNRELTISQFTHWLVKSKPVTIIFEACSTSNYWKQFALEHGHDARLISAKLVSKIRQNQKTDANDALAVVQASQLVNIAFISGKTFAQQELQSLMRMRELSIRQKVALNNHLKALLLEFNIRISSRKGGLSGVIEETLENAENGFCSQFREGLHLAWKAYLNTVSNIAHYDKLLAQTLEAHPDCKKLLALEGVSTINAVNLYIAIGCEDLGIFKTGRDASACIGLTPIQHSTGGKAQLGTIGKKVKNGALRSTLITGAMAMVRQLANREAKTQKELWLKQLIDRRGKKCAAVALANKTVRTAFALLTQRTEYQSQPLVAE